jgi:hypothetical protein
MDTTQTDQFLQSYWKVLYPHFTEIKARGIKNWGDRTLTLSVVWEKQSQSQLSQVYVARYVPEDPALENAGFRPVCSTVKLSIAPPVLIFLASDSDVLNPLRGEIDAQGQLEWFP